MDFSKKNLFRDNLFDEAKIGTMFWKFIDNNKAKLVEIQRSNVHTHTHTRWKSDRVNRIEQVRTEQRRIWKCLCEGDMKRMHRTKSKKKNKMCALMLEFFVHFTSILFKRKLNMCVSVWAREWAYEIPKSAAFDAENIDHSIMKNNRYYIVCVCARLSVFLAIKSWNLRFKSKKERGRRRRRRGTENERMSVKEWQKSKD